jgi:hypothetical protein
VLQPSARSWSSWAVKVADSADADIAEAAVFGLSFGHIFRARKPMETRVQRKCPESLDFRAAAAESTL